MACLVDSSTPMGFKRGEWHVEIPISAAMNREALAGTYIQADQNFIGELKEVKSAYPAPFGRSAQGCSQNDR
jgi:hypothetical protein